MIERVGFYKELEPDRPDLDQGSILDFIQRDPGQFEYRIIDYLSSGIQIIDIMESVLDVVSRDKHIRGAPSVLTDGNWIWRLDLIYYTGRYHLRLPDEFVDHVVAQGFKVMESSQNELVRITEYVESNILHMSVADIPPLQWPRPPKD